MEEELLDFEFEHNGTNYTISEEGAGTVNSHNELEDGIEEIASNVSVASASLQDQMKGEAEKAIEGIM